VAKLPEGRSIEHVLAPSRAGWAQVIAGELLVNGEKLGPGDGAAINDTPRLTLTAAADAHFLLFDLA
jgi:quercetin 2,3-dioxygenase